MATLRKRGSITEFRERIRRARRRLSDPELPISEETLRDALEALGPKAKTAEGKRAIEQALKGAALSLGARFVMDTFFAPPTGARKGGKLSGPLLTPPLPSESHYSASGRVDRIYGTGADDEDGPL